MGTPMGSPFEKPRPFDRVVLFETGTLCRFQMPTGLTQTVVIRLQLRLEMRLEIQENKGKDRCVL
jgi:hypothetical protein